MEQDFSIEEACHHTYNADSIFGKEELDIFQPSGMIQHGNPRKQCMTKTSGKDKAEIEYMNKEDDSKKIKFKTGRNPAEAIEGDLIKFMHKDYVHNSTSWVQGRLSKRIDKLNDAINSEWKMNRFRVDNMSTIVHWGEPIPLPSSAIVNINYCTKWLLGIENDQLDDTDDKKSQKLYLGFYEATCLSLAKKEQGSEGLSEYEPRAMYHTYEISLLPPGKELLNVSDMSHPLYESEEMMEETIQQMAESSLGSDTMANNEEMGTLSVITEQRTIRRFYLNNRVIPTEVDTCSLVSVVMPDDPRFSRKLKIKRKLGSRPVVQNYQNSIISWI